MSSSSSEEEEESDQKPTVQPPKGYGEVKGEPISVDDGDETWLLRIPSMEEIDWKNSAFWFSKKKEKRQGVFGVIRLASGLELTIGNEAIDPEVFRVLEPGQQPSELTYGAAIDRVLAVRQSTQTEQVLQAPLKSKTIPPEQPNKLIGRFMPTGMGYSPKKKKKRKKRSRSSKESLKKQKKKKKKKSKVET